MESVEIVITPRTIERLFFILIVIGLGTLLFFRWEGGNCTATTEDLTEVTANVAADALADGEAQTDAEMSEATLIDPNNPCRNGVKDQDETDVDCGGSCDPCAEYKACNVDEDCDDELYCFQHIKCLKPSCEDGVKNQDETNVDCGGICSGYWWSDAKCHGTKEPSGKLDTTLTASIGESPNSGNAMIDKIAINMQNGLGKYVSLQLNIFVRDKNGNEIFENQEGEIPIESLRISLDPDEKYKKTLDMSENTRRIIPDMKPSDEFQIVLEIRDSVQKLRLDEIVWVN
ncbi:hypothetical protein JW826_06075 [Candidatus Woesearchaeota archaeon]|nr:hypothetical protein [Candidatus Woesearchaeota archaeon]